MIQQKRQWQCRKNRFCLFVSFKMAVAQVLVDTYISLQCGSQWMIQKRKTVQNMFEVWKYFPACSLLLVSMISMIKTDELCAERTCFAFFGEKKIVYVPASCFFLSVPFLNNHDGIAERACYGKKIRKYFAFISFVRPRSCLQVCSVRSKNEYSGIAERTCFAKEVQKYFASFLSVWKTFDKIPTSAWDGSVNT